MQEKKKMGKKVIWVQTVYNQRVELMSTGRCRGQKYKLVQKAASIPEEKGSKDYKILLLAADAWK